MNTPNLTPEPLNGYVTKFREVLYTNQDELCKDRNVDIGVLRLAKKRKAPGFNLSLSKINWTKLQPWFVSNYDVLKAEVEAKRVEEESKETKEADTNPKRERLELAKLKEEVTKLRNYNRERDENFISRKLVLNTVSRLNTEITTELRRVFEHEQPIKAEHLPFEKILEINKQYVDDLVKKLQTPLYEWSNAKDITESGTADTEGEIKEDAAN